MAHPSVETFDITLQFPERCVLYRGGIASTVQAAMVQHRQAMSSVFPNGQSAVRRWTLQGDAVPVADFHRLVDLYHSTRGGCEPIDLTLRGMTLDGSTSETVQVRMMSQPLALDSLNSLYYKFILEVEEFGHAP